MSKYTTEVRFICENAAGYTESQGYDKVEQIIAQSRSKIFDFDYPIFDSDYKSVIETKILKHYYTREIGLETVGLWKHFLNMRMNEIMPYYNKLYTSELLEFNPLYNVKYDITHRGSESGTSTDELEGTELTTRNLVDAETRNLTDLETRNMTDTETKNLTDSVESDTGVTTSNDTLEKFSDTPQGAVTNLNNGTYLTSAKQTENDVQTDTEYDETARHTGTDTIVKTGTDTLARTGTDTFNRTGTNNVAVDNTKSSEFSNTDQYLRHVEGNNGGRSFTELLVEYRKSFLNIDMMVINELHDLFMGVW